MPSVTKIAGAASNDSGIGSLAWQNPSYAITTGSNMANINDLDEVEVSNYLKTVGYAFDIPAGSTIDGVEVLFDSQSRNNNDYINSWARLVKAGVIYTGNTKGPSLNLWPNEPSKATRTFGGPTDTWGGLTADDVNNANFGFALWVDGDTSNTYPHVNNCRITVYYTEPVYYQVAGVVTLNGSPVEGATVRCIRQSDNVAIEEQTTDSSGLYSFVFLDDEDLYHVAVEYENEGTKYNALSLWDLVPVEIE